jgi:SsrA-binding protein
MSQPQAKHEKTLIAKNRRASFDYTIVDHFEAGIVLAGSEVKALRAGKADLSDAYVAVERGEAWLRQMYVGSFEQAKMFPHDGRRVRKLLLHKREVLEIDRAVSREGYTVVPLRLYFKMGRVKVELATAMGKKTHDKRAAIAEQDADRDMRVESRKRY